MHSLAQRVLSHIRRQELLKAGDRVGVAVSGGIDSVALLRLLLELKGELGVVFSVVHFNHKLRGAESDADQDFVAALAHEHDLEFYVDSDDVARVAAEERVSVETAARDLRYGFFRYLIREDRSEQAEGKIPTSRKSGETLRQAQGRLRGTPDGFSSNQRRGILDKIATGHTLDDQAETVLMRMIRGAGLRGLAGIHPRIPVEDENGEISGEIIRPLLTVRRRDLECYLNDIGQCWREDSTNTDEHIMRNRVRKLLVPLLEREFNPAVAENLAELAEIARGEEDYWENEIAGWMGTVVHWSEPEWAHALSRPARLVQIESVQSGSEPSVPVMRSQKTRTLGTAGLDPSTGQERPSQDDNDILAKIEHAPWLVMNASVSRIWFLGEPVAVQRRLVKAIGEQAGIPLEFKHVEEILRFAAEEGASGKELSLPLGWKIVRRPEELIFLTPDLRELTTPKDYEYELDVPKKVNVGQTVLRHTKIAEAGLTIEVRRVPADAQTEYNLDHLLDAESLPGLLRVRNWRPGDRFWPAHTKSPKKIKELLQERHVAQPERRLWPVVVSGDEIVWLRGFPTPTKYRAKPGREAICIVEKPLGEKSAT